MRVDLLGERPEVGLNHHVGVRRVRDRVDGLAGAGVLAVLRRVHHERGFEEEQRFDVGTHRLPREELRDGGEELLVVAVVFVGGEVGERVGAGEDGLYVVGGFGGGFESPATSPSKPSRP